MFCRKCGMDNPEGARYCRRCGEALERPRTSSEGALSGAAPLGAGPSGTASSGAAASSVPPMSRNISIEDLPPEYRPIGMWGYFGYNLLFSIPFVGWIIALVFACGVTSNVNLKNYARGYFCGLIVACVVVFLFSVSGCSILSAMM